MKNKFGLFGFIALTAIIGLLATGCPMDDNGDNNAQTVDRTVLGNDITGAQALLAGTVESVDGTAVPDTSYWAPAAARTAFQGAIAMAQGVYDNGTTQAAVNTAITNLTTARTAFMAARQPGMYASTTVDRAALGNALGEARVLLAGTAISTDGTDVATTAFWVPAAAHAAFAAAIDTAQGVYGDNNATQPAINAAVSNLAAAQANFTAERQPGTSETAVDRTVLAGDIAAAEILLNATFECEDGTGIAPEYYWATHAAIWAFVAAIGTAHGTYSNPASTQTEIDAAIEALAAARATFTAERLPGTYESTTVDRTALGNAVTEANGLIANTAVSEDGSGIAHGYWWAPQAAIGAFSTAIDAAHGTYSYHAATQSAIDAAIETLAAARATFIAARQPGSYGAASADRTALDNAITEAALLLSATVVSEDGTGITVGYWAPQAAMTAFETAINDALITCDDHAATQSAIDAAVETLAAARATFIAARQPGTYDSATVDRTALGNAIIDANNLLLATVGSEDGAGITVGYWAPHAAIMVFTTAIAEAQNAYYDFFATQPTINAAAETLSAAQTTFMAARRSADSDVPSGDGNFTINFRPDISTNITGPTVNLGSTGAAPSITLLNPSQFDTGSIRWLLGDGTPVPTAAVIDEGATITLNSLVHNNRTGAHRVTVEVRIGGVLHSRIINFTVGL